MNDWRPVYGWGIADGDGDLWFQLFSTRREAIAYVEKFLQKSWRTIKRRRALKVVKVELIKSDWGW